MLVEIKDGSDARKRVGFEAAKTGDGSQATRDATAAAEAAEARREQLRRSKQAAIHARHGRQWLAAAAQPEEAMAAELAKMRDSRGERCANRSDAWDRP